MLSVNPSRGAMTPAKDLYRSQALRIWRLEAAWDSIPSGVGSFNRDPLGSVFGHGSKRGVIR